MEPFIGEIKMVGFNFAPNGFAFCNGQLIPIAQQTALFSLLGTTYGGDGKTTFGLPDLQGRFPMHAGSGLGLTNRTLGEKAGIESVTLAVGQLPPHSHATTLGVSSQTATSATPGGSVLAKAADGESNYGAPATADGAMACTVAGTGGGQAHDNMPPYLVVSFIIALQGIFPSRS